MNLTDLGSIMTMNILTKLIYSEILWRSGSQIWVWYFVKIIPSKNKNRWWEESIDSIQALQAPRWSLGRAQPIHRLQAPGRHANQAPVSCHDSRQWRPPIFIVYYSFSQPCNAGERRILSVFYDQPLHSGTLHLLIPLECGTTQLASGLLNSLGFRISLSLPPTAL
jgi:hypothetical protein